MEKKACTNILLLEDNHYLDVFVKRWLLKQIPEGGCLFTDKKRISEVDLVVITNENNETISDEILANSRRVIVFTTDHSPSKTSYPTYSFLPFREIVELAGEGKMYPVGTKFCDIGLWFEDWSLEGALEIKGVSFVYNGEISFRESVCEYFEKDLEIVDYKNPEGPTLRNISLSNPFRIKKIGILIPTYHRIEKAKKSIESIISRLSGSGVTSPEEQPYLSDYGHLGREFSRNEYRIYIGDNGTGSEEMRKMLIEFDKEEKIKVYFSPTNLGKARMVNRLYALMKEEDFEADYIFSIDSDMVYRPPGGEKYKFSRNAFDGMIHVLEDCQNVGLVAANQLGECHHWYGRGIVDRKENGYKISESEIGVGIAGGCIVVRTSDWEKIGGYREDYDIYTADDAILMDKIEKDLGKRAVISGDYAFFHPPPTEDEKGYAMWKKERFEKDGMRFREEGHRGIEKGFYEN